MYVKYTKPILIQKAIYNGEIWRKNTNKESQKYAT